MRCSVSTRFSREPCWTTSSSSGINERVTPMLSIHERSRPRRCPLPHNKSAILKEILRSAEKPQQSDIGHRLVLRGPDARSRTPKGPCNDSAKRYIPAVRHGYLITVGLSERFWE